MSTPPNAMAYSSGDLTSRDFICSGYIGALGTLIILLLPRVVGG